MKVYLSPSLMNEEANFQELNRIFPFFEEEKHWLCINTEEDLDAIKNSKWFLSLASYLQNIYHDILNNAFDRSATDNSFAHEFAKIHLLYFFLSEPLYLIVESEFSDVYFLEMLMRCFPKQSKKIKKAIEKKPKWIHIRHAGGKGKLENIAEKIRKENEFARIFIFRDSDKRYPKNKNKDVTSLESFCQRQNISYHILEKREIENYLPISALESLSNSQNIVNAFKNLSDAQKDFYDMEKGFEGKNEIPKDANNYEGLWDNIVKGSELFKHLRYGFAGNKGKNIFEQLFKDEKYITAEGLLTRCKSTGEGELKDLLANITAKL